MLNTHTLTDSSMLIHELIHYKQYKEGKLMFVSSLDRAIPICYDWQDEVEAYNAQYGKKLTDEYLEKIRCGEINEGKLNYKDLSKESLNIDMRLEELELHHNYLQSRYDINFRNLLNLSENVAWEQAKGLSLKVYLETLKNAKN